MLNKIPKQLLLLLTLPFLLGFNSLAAQDITISGEVIDADDGLPIPGVNVLVVGTDDVGTVTNIDGEYQLTVPEGYTELQFSYIGYQTQRIPIEGREVINVTMEMATVAGQELIVIGYGQARSMDLTAPISTITAETISRNVGTNAISALQGSVPGMQVTNVGSPGATPQIRVRGIGSMQGADPLYVVDGMFYNDINWLNPTDIESISVLKDASAASIYGVRAAGGVIMVTTKQGSRDEGVVIEYDGYAGFNTTSNLMQMANTEQYSTMLIEAGISSRLQPSVDLWGGQPFTHNGEQYTIPATDTDWYGELLGSRGGTAPIMNHSLSVRGGTDRTTYHVGGSYTGEDGMFQDADHRWQRINVRSNINFMPYDFLDLGASFNLNQTRTDNQASAWGGMYHAVPTIPVRNSEVEDDFAGVVDAGYNVGPVNNPAASLYFSQGNWNYNRSLNLDYNAFANIRFLGDDRLELRSQFSHSIGRGDSRNYSPRYHIDDKLRNDNSSMSRNFNNSSTMHLDNILTYRDSFSSHNLTLMAGNSIRMYRGFGMGGSAANVPGGQEHYLYFGNAEDASPENFSVSDQGSTEVGASFFGRMMYNYRERYMLNATMRADGTDKYTETWGYFPSFGVGWMVSEEDFMREQTLFNELKIRASWGRLGNNNVPRESGAREITTGTGVSYAFDNQWAPGYRPSVFFNTLVWELTDEYNVGIELSTMDYRLSAEIDWFRKITKDAAIWTSNLMGGGGLIRNQGEILNTGFEFLVNWRDEAGEVGYNMSANLSTLHNEVLNLGGEPYIQSGESTQPYRSTPGHQLYSWYGYVVEGVYQNWEEIENHIDTDVHSQVRPGFLRFQDVNGDGIIDENDRQHLGANLPKFTYGGQIQLEYRNFDFSTSVYGVYGNKIFNSLRGGRSHHGDYNFEVDMYENRWTGEGSTNSYPSAEGMLHSWNVGNTNTFLVEDGSFFRIQNITLGYTFHDLIPGSETGSSVRFRVTAQNPFTTFKFNGFTPEATGVGRVGGVNPIPQSFTIGVNITY
jgi:TonB-linked SusC/RagA family outer membrane protein